MIRLATRWDIPQLVELLREFNHYNPITPSRLNTNQRWVERQLENIIMLSGVAWVDDGDGEIRGTLLVTRAPLFWNCDIIVLQEVAFWVKPHYRGGLIAGRLMAKLRHYAREHRLPVVFTTLPSSDINLERSGYRVGETQWIGEF